MFTRALPRLLLNYSARRFVKPHRLIHSSRLLAYKKFENRESDFSSQFVVQHDFSKYLDELKCKQRPEYSEELLNAATVDAKSNDELIQMVEVIAEHCHEFEESIESEKFDGIVRKIAERVASFSDDEIVRMLMVLPKIPHTLDPLTKNYADLWQAVDAECVNRVPIWKPPYLMKMCSLWNKLDLCKIGQFSRNAIKKSVRYVRKCSPKELVEIMFFINVSRRRMDEMVHIELEIIKHFQHFSIEEIGVICIAFFKTQTKMKSFELITHIYDALLQNLDGIADITLASILKNLRYCSDFMHVERLERLCDAMALKTEEVSLMCCLHMALLGTNLQICNQQMMENIVQRFIANIKEVRVKDLERLTLAIGLFNFKCRDESEKILLEKIVQEMKLRVSEFGQHPKCLSACMHYMTLSGVYDVEIIKSVMSPKYLKFTYGKNHFAIGREVLCLDSYARINLKDVYDGPLLPDGMRKNITKFQSCYVPARIQKWKLTQTDKLTLDIRDELEKNYGPTKLTHVLPHFQMCDIILCFDKNGNPVTEKILDAFPPDFSSEILSKERLLSQVPEFKDNIDDYKIVSVVIGGWNLFIRNDSRPTGGLAMKEQQLKLIGLEPVIVFWANWMRKHEDERNHLLHEQIRKAIAN